MANQDPFWYLNDEQRKQLDKINDLLLSGIIVPPPDDLKIPKDANLDILPWLRDFAIDGGVSKKYFMQFKKIFYDLLESDPDIYKSLGIDKVLSSFCLHPDGFYMLDSWSSEQLLNEFIKRIEARTHASLKQSGFSNISNADIVSSLRDLCNEVENNYKYYQWPAWYYGRMSFLLRSIEKHPSSEIDKESFAFFENITNLLNRMVFTGRGACGKGSRKVFARGFTYMHFLNQEDFGSIGNDFLAEGEELIRKAREAQDFDEFYENLYLAYPKFFASCDAYHTSLQYQPQETTQKQLLGRAVHSEEMYVNIGVTLNRRAHSCEESILAFLQYFLIEAFVERGLLGVKECLIERIDIHVQYPNFIKEMALAWFSQDQCPGLMFGKIYKEGEQANLCNQGLKLYQIGKVDHALVLYSEAERICREVDDQDGLWSVLNNKAIVYRDIGDLEKALTLHNEAESILRKLDDPNGLVKTLINTSLVLQDMNRIFAASRLATEAQNIALDIQDEELIKLVDEYMIDLPHEMDEPSRELGDKLPEISIESGKKQKKHFVSIVVMLVALLFLGGVIYWYLDTNLESKGLILCLAACRRDKHFYNMNSALRANWPLISANAA